MDTGVKIYTAYACLTETSLSRERVLTGMYNPSVAKDKDTEKDEKDQPKPPEEVAEELDPPDWVKSVDQNEALQKYRVTGVVGDYVDPTRDQEIDIAPRFGDAPHPELANPEPAGGHPLGQKVPGSLADAAAFDPATQEVKPVAVDVAQLPPDDQPKADKPSEDQNDSPKAAPVTSTRNK